MYGDREYLNRDTQALTLEARARRDWIEIYDGNNPDNPRRFENQYELIKFWYGMKSRGYSIGCQPKDGLIEVKDDPEGEYHNILVYDRRLTDKEIADYERAFVKFDYNL